MILAAVDVIQWISLVLGAGALIGAAVNWFKAPTEKDVAKRSISVDEAREIRETLTSTLDQVQEERDGARKEARTLRGEVVECHNQCDAIKAENTNLKAELAQAQRALDRALGQLERAEIKIEKLDTKVQELTQQLENLS